MSYPSILGFADVDPWDSGQHDARAFLQMMDDSRGARQIERYLR